MSRPQLRPQAGACPNAVEIDGTTPLLVLRAAGHVAAGAISALLRAGAEADGARDDGLTPLYAAACEGHAHIAAQLLDAGADVNGGRQRRGNGGARGRGGYAHFATRPLSYSGVRQAGAGLTYI